MGEPYAIWPESSRPRFEGRPESSRPFAACPNLSLSQLSCLYPLSIYAEQIVLKTCVLWESRVCKVLLRVNVCADMYTPSSLCMCYKNKMNVEFKVKLYDKVCYYPRFWDLSVWKIFFRWSCPDVGEVKNIPTIDSGYLWNICIQSNLNPNNRSNKKLVMFTAVDVMVVCMVTSATGPF